MIDVQEYIAADGSCPYEKLFNSLNAQAAAKVAIAITRISQGNLSNVKGLRGGLHEYGLSSCWVGQKSGNRRTSAAL